MSSSIAPARILAQVLWISLGFAAGGTIAALAIPRFVTAAPTIEQAASLADNEKWEEAAHCLEYIPRGQRSDPQVLALWTRAYFGLGQMESALNAVRQIPSFSPQGPVARFQEGRILWELRRVAAAERAWTECLKLVPNHTEARWKLLMIYDLQERREDAVGVAIDLTRYETDPIAPLLELIRQDAERLAPSAALELWRTAVAHDPDDSHSRRMLGKSHVLMGNANEGIPLMEQAAQRDPSDWIGWEALLWALFENGDLAKAEETLAQLAAPAAETPWYWKYYGRMVETQGNVSKATECYERSLQFDPYDRKTHYQLGRMYRRAGRDDLVELHEETARQLDEWRESLHVSYAHLSKHRHKDRDVALLRHIAKLCEQLGRQQEANAWSAIFGERRPPASKQELGSR